MLGQANHYYRDVETYHDEYLTALNPDDILDAKQQRDMGLEAGNQYETTGWVLVGTAAGTALATMLSAIHGQKQVKGVQVAIVPFVGIPGAGFTGRW